MAFTTFHSLSRRLTPRVSVFPLGIKTRTVHTNYHGISTVICIYWTMSMSCIQLPGFFWEGGCSLSRIGLTDTLLEVFWKEVGVSAWLVGAEVLGWCLHLRLWCDTIVNMKGVNVGGQRLGRALRVLTLVYGSAVLGDFTHIIQGRVGRPGRRVAVPAFEDCVWSTEVHVSCWRFNACSDLCCRLLWLPLGVL